MFLFAKKLELKSFYIFEGFIVVLVNSTKFESVFLERVRQYINKNSHICLTFWAVSIFIYLPTFFFYYVFSI